MPTKLYLTALAALLLFASCGNKRLANTTVESAPQSSEDSYVYQVLKDTVVSGDFNGDGRQEYAVLVHATFDDRRYEAHRAVEEGDVSEHYDYIMFTDTTVPIIQSDYAWFYYPIQNEGDLDGDGCDELGYYAVGTPYGSNWNGYRVYALKKAEWKLLTSFTLWDGHIDLDNEQECQKLVTRSSKKGYVNILESEWINDDVAVTKKTVKMNQKLNR